MRPLHERISLVMEVGEFRLVSKLAKSMRTTVSAVRDAVEEAENLDLIVGMRTGSGHASLPLSQYQVEKYDK